LRAIHFGKLPDLSLFYIPLSTASYQDHKALLNLCLYRRVQNLDILQELLHQSSSLLAESNQLVRRLLTASNFREELRIDRVYAQIYDAGFGTLYQIVGS